jgi:hypothetical protein
MRRARIPRSALNCRVLSSPRKPEALRQQMLLRALWRDARPGVVEGWLRDGGALCAACRPTRPTPARWPNARWRPPIPP